MPKMLAEFELDDQGRPKCSEGENQRHYKVRLFLEDAPPDASSVRYILHPTYLEPIRLVPRGVKNFEEFLTSYGDYEIKGVVNRHREAERFSRSLTDALEERYGSSATPEIRQAIEELRSR